MSLLVHPKIIPCIKFEHYGIIRFFLIVLRTNRKTNRQTDGL